MFESLHVRNKEKLPEYVKISMQYQGQSSPNVKIFMAQVRY